MKILKWVLTLITGIASILAIMTIPKWSGNKRKKIKTLDKKIKKVNKELEKKENQQKSLQKTLKSKKKVLEEIKEKKYKKKNVSTKEASDFLKNFSKKKVKK